MRAIKIVCIGGFGHWFNVLDQMHALEAVEFSAIAPAYSGEPLDAIKDNMHFNETVQVFEDYEQMLNHVLPDVAIVSTRLDRIPSVCMAVAERRIHCIAEKPLALDCHTLRVLYQTVRKNDVRLVAMLTSRGEPVFRAARQVYQSGVIGEVLLVNAQKSYKWGVRPSWFADRRHYGGTIPWIGIHGLDFINFITERRFHSTAAQHGNFAHPEFPSCEDHCVMILELDNGGHATISVDYLRPQSASSHGDDRVRIVGTKGSVEVSGTDEVCMVLEEGRLPYKVELAPPKFIFAEFLESIRSNTSCELSTDISFMLTDAVLQAREAADRKTLIQIDMNYWK